MKPCAVGQRWLERLLYPLEMRQYCARTVCQEDGAEVNSTNMRRIEPINLMLRDLMRTWPSRT
jgi:hypothetical protein